MGWSFGWQSKEQLVKERTTGWESTRNGRTVVASYGEYALRGNHLWKIATYRVTENGRTVVESVICLDLLKKDRTDHTWGYKGLSEVSGPYYHDVPVKFLKKVPCPDSEFARAWRARVDTYNREKKQRKELSHVVIH